MGRPESWSCSTAPSSMMRARRRPTGCAGRLPRSVLEDLVPEALVVPVVVRGGFVVHAPGELHLGRTTRLRECGAEASVTRAVPEVRGARLRRPVPLLQGPPRRLASRRPHRSRQLDAGVQPPSHRNPPRGMGGGSPPRPHGHRDPADGRSHDVWAAEARAVSVYRRCSAAFADWGVGVATGRAPQRRWCCGRSRARSARAARRRWCCGRSRARSARAARRRWCCGRPRGAVDGPIVSSAAVVDWMVRVGVVVVGRRPPHRQGDDQHDRSRQKRRRRR